MPAGPHEHGAHDGGEDACDNGRDGDEPEGRRALEDAQLKEGRRVRPDAEEDALAERDVARETGDDVPAAPHDREEEREDDHVLVVAVVPEDRIESEKEESGRDGRTQPMSGEQRPGPADRHATCGGRRHLTTSSRSFAPMIPCGLARRTTMITA